MTAEEQRIAIGKACGWEPVEPKKMPGTKSFLNNVTHAFRKDGAYYGGLNALPRYEEDLNAMHEAEKELIKRNLFQDYWPRLEHIVGRSTGWIAHATAAHKAEAFLKTLSLWKD